MRGITEAQEVRIHKLARIYDITPAEMLRRAVELGLTALDLGSPPTHTWPPRNGDNLARAWAANVTRREDQERARV